MTIPASPFLLNPAPAFFLPFEITSTDALPNILQFPVFVNTTPWPDLVATWYSDSSCFGSLVPPLIENVLNPLW